LQTVRRAIDIGLNTGQSAEVVANAALPPLLAADGAAFVTLRQNGQLRGCVGSPVAWRPLVEDVVDHAFNAAFRDPRFPPLALGEEPALDLSVSVLTPAAPITFSGEADLLAQLRPRVDGLMIDDAGRRALFLPSVWADIPDPHMFLTQLKLKAGLRADHFSSGFTVRRFRAIDVKGRMADHDPASNPVVLAATTDPVGGTPFGRRN
jgi:AmmeMemoRadiSam system protein A